MSQHREMDPLDALRDANPVTDDALPHASLARVRARVYEEPMTTNPILRRRPEQPRARGVLGAAGALALVLLLGAGASTWLVPAGTTGPGMASCVEQYSLANLANRAFAFDGTVSSIDGERVTFTVGTAYRGVSDGDSVTLDAPGMTGTAITSAGGPTLVVGGRYLVAGESTFAWPCGFTQPYDATVASSWAAALGG